MSASKGLSRLLHMLLDSGITVDDGKERITIAATRTTGRRTTKGALTFTVRTVPSGRAHGGRNLEFPTTAFTPTGKVSSRKLHAIIAHFPDGISSSDLTRQAGVARAKLLPTIQKLTAKGLVSERNGRFFPVAGGADSPRTSRRRVHDMCTVPGCHDAHYAKGLCNNHYNSMRRQQARQGMNEAAAKRDALSFKDAIINRLRESREQSLFELAAALNEKWQTLRKDIQELVTENKVIKDGKRYLLPR